MSEFYIDFIQVSPRHGTQLMLLLEQMLELAKLNNAIVIADFNGNEINVLKHSDINKIFNIIMNCNGTEKG